MQGSSGLTVWRNWRPLGQRLSMGAALVLTLASASWAAQTPVRQRVSFNADWRFAKGDPNGAAGKLGYTSIRDWVLATGAAFAKDPNFAHRRRPAGNLGADVAYTQPQFDDQPWRPVTLPHDWAIEGPFDPKAPGGTGKLPFAGIGWYRKHFTVPAGDQGRQVYLDVDGAMSYANVWLNGQYVGGWPYGYASWQVDLTPYVKFGGENVLAIRLENPPNSSRWYPGGGIYRNVWLVKTGPVHVGHWGTYLTTPEVSSAAATVKLKVTVDNRSQQAANVRVSTQIFPLDAGGHAAESAVTGIAPLSLQVPPEGSAVVEGTGTVAHPRLWGPPPQQRPHRYVAVTTVAQGDNVVDTYETPFGIRTLKFDPNGGFFINGEHILLNGVNNHHDFGALGATVNYRALQRQLEMLMDMGCNALRTSHNPPAPELLELADTMGLLVMDEAFDMWVRRKTPQDFHLIFPDWGEQDLRALVRRDRNHPSVILWSIGNEVGEQFTGDGGAALARKLSAIVHEEDPTRPATTAMNVAKATSPFAAAVDVVSLNYQGAGIRNIPGQFPAFHQALPDRLHPRAAKRLPPSAAAANTCSPSPAGSVRPSDRIPVKTRSSTPGERLRVVLRGLWRFRGQGVCLTGAASVRRRRIRVDRLGLSRRADAFLFVPEFLLRHHRSGRFQEGPLLPVSSPLASRFSHGPYPAALDLARPRRSGDAGTRLHLRRRSGTVPQRQVPRQEDQGPI